MALVFPATAWHAEEQLSLAKAALLFADCLSSSARRSLLAYIDAFSLFSHFDSTAPTPPRITMPVIEANNVTEWNTALRAAKAAGRTVIVDAYAVRSPFPATAASLLVAWLTQHTLSRKQTWCGPCKAIAPVFDKLASTVDWVTFVRFDVDKCPSIAQAKKITAMPTFLAIRNGETVETVRLWRYGLWSSEEKLTFARSDLAAQRSRSRRAEPPRLHARRPEPAYSPTLTGSGSAQGGRECLLQERRF